MKKFISIILALTLLLLPMSVSANSEAQTVDEKIIDVFDAFFTGNGTAYNKNNIDVTSTFYARYLGTYNTGDYATIYEGMKTMEIARIKTHKISESTQRLSLSKSYSDYDLVLMEHSGRPFDGKTWYFLVEASGVFTYNDSTFEITSFPRPTVECSFHDIGAAFSGTYGYVLPTPEINSDKSAATFDVRATQVIYYDFNGAIDESPVGDEGIGVDYPISGTLGTYHSTSSFEIDI